MLITEAMFKLINDEAIFSKYVQNIIVKVVVSDSASSEQTLLDLANKMSLETFERTKLAFFTMFVNEWICVQVLTITTTLDRDMLATSIAHITYVINKYKAKYLEYMSKTLDVSIEISINSDIGQHFMVKLTDKPVFILYSEQAIDDGFAIGTGIWLTD